MFGLFRKRKTLEEIATEAGIKFIRPELVEAMKDPNFSLPLNKFENVQINYLLVALDGETPSTIGKSIGVVAKIAKECHWYSDCLFSNLAVLINASQLSNVPQSSRQELLAKITSEFGSQCKSVGGEQVVPWGNYGSADRMVYGAMLPDYLGMVSQLSQLQFGTHVDRNAL